jgi:hypothetical protein
MGTITTPIQMPLPAKILMKTTEKVKRDKQMTTKVTQSNPDRAMALRF